MVRERFSVSKFVRRSRHRVGGFVAVSFVLAGLAVFPGAASSSTPCAANGSAPASATKLSADGDTLYGSPCADRIVVTSPEVEEVIAGEGNDVIFANPDVEVVNGGPGDDVIYGDLPEAEGQVQYTPTARPAMGLPRESGMATASLTEKKCKANESCYGGDGSQELIGSEGNDRIFGQRGNDILKGGNGNDELFGGVGDESLISGGSGSDLLSGGLGTDLLNGNQDSDLVRGDGTIDTIEDTGAAGTDTLSFATATTPGFNGSVAISGFPADSDGEERGVSLRLDGTTCAGEYEACDNDARYGGGYDNVAASGFENAIGSPFADTIVGSSSANRIDGGGGTDILQGGGGDDTIYGGPDGDYIVGEEGTDTVDGQGGVDNCVAETTTGCAGTAEAVTQRDRSKISVGFMVTSAPATLGWVELFLTGSTATDRVRAAYSTEGEAKYVTFTTEGESAAFDTSADAASTGCTYEASKVKCTLRKALDAITAAGMAGADYLTLEGFPETTSPILLGGEGGDELSTSNGTEDLLVDGNGAGNDVLRAGNYDDALINNEGVDNLQGGNGNDLLLSASNCGGDTLQGAAAGEGDGTAVNSTSWAKLPEGFPGVVADLEKGKAGDSWSGSVPACTSGTPSTLANIDDLEGSSGADQLYGDAHDNNMLGRLGKDEMYGREGADRIEAKDEIAEVGGGGPGTDSCTLDASDKFNSCP